VDETVGAHVNYLDATDVDGTATLPFPGGVAVEFKPI
jgi:hypothetical protein